MLRLSAVLRLLLLPIGSLLLAPAVHSADGCALTGVTSNCSDCSALRRTFASRTLGVLRLLRRRRSRIDARLLFS